MTAGGTGPTGGPGNPLQQFEAERDRLFGTAYRLLGSVTDAEDVVQDAYLRWADAAGTHIDNPAAYLTTIVTRLALDRLRSARHRREHYVGPWLPEPAAVAPGPDDDVILAESLTVGFLAVLERLGPVERAVFVLHDVFGLPFAQIAPVVDRTEVNCRQIARRARGRVHGDGPEPGRVLGRRPQRADELLEAFLGAVVAGDVDGLERLLAEDVVHVSDGGPDRYAARVPVVGRRRVARLLINLAAREYQDVAVRLTSLNGESALVVSAEGRTELAVIISATDGLVHRVWAVVNPDKLAHLGQSG